MAKENYLKTDSIIRLIKSVFDTLGVDKPCYPMWESRLRSTVAIAYDSGVIALNSRAWHHMSSYERYTIIVHEACHVAVGVNHGHGKTWKQAMVKCGLQPKTRPRVLIPGYISGRVDIYCACGTSQATKPLVTYIKDGGKTRCSKCEQPYTLEDNRTQVDIEDYIDE